MQMSVTTLRAVKLLSEITEDYFYLEDLIEKLDMNKATESKTLKNAREQVVSIFSTLTESATIMSVYEIQAKEAVGFLQDRTEFWMQHSPQQKKDDPMTRLNLS